MKLIKLNVIFFLFHRNHEPSKLEDNFSQKSNEFNVEKYKIKNKMAINYYYILVPMIIRTY